MDGIVTREIVAPASSQRLAPVDVEVSNHGSIFLFDLNTPEARAFVEERVSEPTYFGEALAVEHRFARDLAGGMLDAGLEVR